MQFDCSRAEKEIGWLPAAGIASGLQETSPQNLHCDSGDPDSTATGTRALLAPSMRMPCVDLKTAVTSAGTSRRCAKQRTGASTSTPRRSKRRSRREPRPPTGRTDIDCREVRLTASTRSSAVIQKVLFANGTDSSDVNVLVSASALPAAAAWRLATFPSLWSCDSILPTYPPRTVPAVARAAVAWCCTLRYIRREPAISTTASTTTVGSHPRSRFLINAATSMYRDVLCGRCS